MGFTSDSGERLLEGDGSQASQEYIAEDVIEALEEELERDLHDYWHYAADLLGDAASVVIAWSWSDVIYKGFSELESEFKKHHHKVFSYRLSGPLVCRFYSRSLQVAASWTPDAFSFLYAIIISGLATLLVRSPTALLTHSRVPESHCPHGHRSSIVIHYYPWP